MITFPILGNAGRLGNQLWQIASTLGIAHALEDDVSFPPWAYQPFFSVPGELFTNLSGRPAYETPLAEHMHPAARTYLQDYNLFRGIDPQVREYLAPSPVARKELAQEKYNDFFTLERPILSVHVRRGDNVPGQDPGTPDKAQYHPLRPMSYYRDAIALFPQAESIAIFSDDIPWCRKNFADLDAYYFEGVARPKEHEPAYHTAPVLDWIDLFLMAEAELHICSNSTYSWWGAFLSNDPSPVVPSPWFGPKLRYIDASLMIPTTWRVLNHGR